MKINNLLRLGNLQRQPIHSRRRGLVLVLVLVTIAVLSLAAFTFAELMLSEHQAASVEGRNASRVLAESAGEMLKMYLVQTPDVLTQAGGTYDNATQFQAVQVVDDGTTRQWTL